MRNCHGIITLNTFAVRSIRNLVFWEGLKLIYLLALGSTLSIGLFYNILIMETSSGTTEKTRHWWKTCKRLKTKTPRIILVLPPRAFSSDALAKFHWTPLLPRNAWHRDIFVNKSYNLLNDMTVFSASLSAIISKSSNTEDFPLKWKTAKISPCI